MPRYARRHEDQAGACYRPAMHCVGRDGRVVDKPCQDPAAAFPGSQVGFVLVAKVDLNRDSLILAVELEIL